MAEKKEAKEMTIDEAFVKLEDTIEKLEAEDVSLEASFQIYKEGMDLLKFCNEKIDKVEKKVLVLEENGELNEF